ncbi:hypothetical protein I7I50_06617 [Histoplasma capsulatum G186AR]|uniref:Uncharacterized protein n=1 Tax=Ajellomyces capsulatus TaxID=5037 RepID=A0A8H7Z0L4_AJECA|nr:hypothetical protein I7I52_10312 [Histoplasma capsulatum]QSS67514.1 hypothetical protein I7I50_06617 [Histoplasma capsulatum G186AR]
MIWEDLRCVMTASKDHSWFKYEIDLDMDIGCRVVSGNANVLSMAQSSIVSPLVLRALCPGESVLVNINCLMRRQGSLCK